MTRGMLSTGVSPRFDPDRASGRPMVLTLRRSCSSEVSPFVSVMYGYEL